FTQALSSAAGTVLFPIITEVPPDAWYVIPLALTIGNLWLPMIILILTAMMRFPDGDWPGRWGAIGGWVFIGSMTLAGLLETVVPDRSGDLVPLFEVPDVVFGVLSAVSGVATVSVLGWNVVSGLRSGPVRRRQLALPLLFLAAFLAFALVAERINTRAGEIIGMASFILFPLVIVASVMRYRLYEIDRVVSRTVTYVLTVGVLGVVYLGSVVALRGLLPFEGSIPVALSTLAVAFLFLPLARRVQSVVDRRFFRSRYDAEAVIVAFATELRSTLDPEAAVARAESVVAATFEAEMVDVWMAPPRDRAEP
ncbi:MAG: hypothetical protein R3246_15935, partial [Acidimicrobiia bacterium]|nr:hypothetical protein [Acidimicrobiia bacterium]